jgi:hypothetical protein
LRAESFTICPAPKEKEKKRTSQSDFQNKSYSKSTQGSDFPKKKALENQPN